MTRENSEQDETAIDHHRERIISMISPRQDRLSEVTRGKFPPRGNEIANLTIECTSKRNCRPRPSANTNYVRDVSREQRYFAVLIASQEKDGEQSRWGKKQIK
jgi:hypothetical protein